MAGQIGKCRFDMSLAAHEYTCQQRIAESKEAFAKRIAHATARWIFNGMCDPSMLVNSYFKQFADNTENLIIRAEIEGVANQHIPLFVVETRRRLCEISR